MKMDEIKEIARQRGINLAKMKKTDLIRTIQLYEGNHQCFNTGGQDNCGQESCLWQEDCN
jgi:hypothetical protein